jgi:hypothetical protein
MSREEVIELMKSAISEKDWNAKCDQVKKACNGYPDYWYAEIVMSGLLSRAQSTW